MLPTIFVIALGAIIILLLWDTDKKIMNAAKYPPADHPDRSVGHDMAMRDPEEQDPERWDGLA